MILSGMVSGSDADYGRMCIVLCQRLNDKQTNHGLMRITDRSIAVGDVAYGETFSSIGFRDELVEEMGDEFTHPQGWCVAGFDMGFDMNYDTWSNARGFRVIAYCYIDVEHMACL